MVLKKSQHLGKWDYRFIVINSEGLFSYRNPNEPYTLCIKGKSLKYIWTRFDMEKGHLVVKLKHGIDKTEFAIPVVNYCLRNEHNWLWPFYRLLMENNIMHFLK